MRILFYAGGVAGSGHVVLGLSLANALRRAGIEAGYRILSVETPFVGLAGRLGVDIETIPAEDELALDPRHYRESRLWKAIDAYRPDILVVDLIWFTLDAFIRELPCKKAIIIRQVDPRYFNLRLAERELVFRPDDYVLVIRTEPAFELPFPSTEIDPLIIRSRDEILPAEQARAGLELGPEEAACLFAFNGNSDEGARAWKSYSYLEEEGWKVIRSDNRQGGLFPAVDWFNAFDLLVCGAGYSAFWEARYFQKEASFVPFQRRFENQALRVAVCSDYCPENNGADTLVDMLAGL